MKSCLLCRCLDSILHAEHKEILEEMRADYFKSDSAENKQNGDLVDGQSSDSANGSVINGVKSIEANEDEKNEGGNAMSQLDYVLELRKLLGSPAKNVERYHQLLYKSSFLLFYDFMNKFAI